MVADATWAEEAGLASLWIPQIPDDFDALTAAVLIGSATSTIEVGTAVGHRSSRVTRRAGPSGAVHPGGVRRPIDLGGSACRTIGSSTRCWGFPTSAPQPPCATTSTSWTRHWPGPGRGRRRERAVPGPSAHGRHRHHADTGHDRRTGTGDAAIAGERTDGTILWLADERAIETQSPHAEQGGGGGRRGVPRIVAGVPICLCGDDEVDVAVARANRVLSESEVSPNYQKLLDRGDARTVGDILAAGSEESIRRRLRAFADAGATDVSLRVVPIGETREDKLASSRRTREFVASLAGSI